jgi:TonB family protein
MKLRFTRKRKIGFGISVILITAIVYYIVNAGYSEISIPTTPMETEVVGVRYEDKFSAELISAVPISYFYWMSGERIIQPHIPPPRSTEIEFYVSESGEVDWAKVHGSSGNNILDTQVRDIVKTWLYNPQATGKLRIRINWIKSEISEIEVFMGDLIFKYGSVKLRHPYIGQDNSFRVIERGRPIQK